jgi:hypothetical protein
MAAQTTFDLDDAKDLLKQLENFHEAMKQDWSRVQNQWANLRSCWHDDQYQTFEPLYEKLAATHKDSQKESEEYISFMREQVRIAEERRAKLGALKGL